MPPLSRSDQYHRLIEQVCGIVRADPTQRLSLESAAEQHGLSPVRLHQIFGDVYNENFGAFVRRVRLEYAIGLMRAFKNRSLTWIAHEAGFTESSDFTRSFKRSYGMPPSRWDRVSPLVYQVKADMDKQSGPDSDTYPIIPNFDKMPVTMREFPARQVAVLHIHGAMDFSKLAAGFDQLEAWLKSRDQIKPDRHFMGISYDSDLDTPADIYRFELAYEVDEDTLPDDGILIRTLDKTKAAVLPCQGGHTEFITAWDYLKRQFLPESRWIHGKAPEMEIYYADPRKTNMTYWNMDCVMPVMLDSFDE